MRTTALLAVLFLAACGSATGGAPCSTPPPADVAGQGQDCGAGGHLTESITTDARTYSPGAPITITVTATNSSTGECAALTACPPLDVRVYDAGGKQVWSSERPGVACPAMVRLLGPGESVSYPVTTSGVQLKVGVYSATGPRPDTVVQYGRAYFSVC